MRSLQKNKYSVSKTISFELKPEGNTEKIIQERRIIETDKERARAAEEVKKYIDRYNKYVIEQVLNSLFLDEIPEYASLYYKKNKNAEEIKEIEEVEDQIRKKVSDAFKNSILQKHHFSCSCIN